MKKTNKIILCIAITLSIIIGGAYYLLTPNDKVDVSTNNNIITKEELLKGSFIENLQVLKNPLRLDGSISVSEDELRNIIYTIMTEYDIEDLKYTNIQINKNSIKVILPYKILKLIDTQYEVEIVPSIIENDLNITLDNLKIGKIKIGNGILSKILNSYKDEIPFEIKENTVIFDKKYMYPVTINKINIKDNKIFLDLEVKATNLIDFIKSYNLKINI